MYDDVVESILRDILDTIPDGVFVTNADREIIFWNEAAARITGYTVEDVLGTRCCDDLLVHQDGDGRPLCDEPCFLQTTLATGVAQEATEAYLRRDDGERLGVTVRTQCLNVGGEAYGVELFRELTTVGARDVALAVQEISDSPVTDPLTGLLNQHYCDALLEQQFALYKRVGLHFAVTRIDVDALNVINDDHGRSAGDEALRFIAAILADNTRKMDTLARLDDDEFLIISPIRSAEGADGIGRRSLGLIHGSQFITPREEIVPLHVSIGATVVRAEDGGEREIMARALAALHAVKDAGGNGFRFAG